MAYTIYPEYRPPVTGPRVRRLWAKAFGVNGVLSGFDMQSIVDSSGSLEIVLDSGTFISGGCVVSCLEDTTLILSGDERLSFYVCAYYYEPDDKADVAVFTHPKENWVILGRYIGGEWIPSDKASSSDLNLSLQQHMTDAEIHIDADAREAFENSISPSKYNYYLTQTDTNIGTVFSPADMQCAVASKSINNSSSIIPEDRDYNMVAFSFSEGHADVKDNTISDCHGLVCDGEKAYFDIDYSESILAAVENANTFNFSPSGAEDVLADKLTTLTKGTEDLRASITFIIDPPIADMIPAVMIDPSDTVSKIIVSSYSDSGLIASNQYDDVVAGKLKFYHSKNRPQDSTDITSLSVEIVGEANSSITISSCCQLPSFTIQHLSESDVPSIKNFRVAPLAGENISGLVCHVGTDGRDQMWAPSFVNRNHPEEQTLTELRRYATISVAPSNIMVAKSAASPWPEYRAGYCTTDVKDTGAIFVIGGYGMSMTPVNSVIAYSKTVDTYRVIGMSDSIMANKSSSCSFGNDTVITGGVGGLSDFTSIVNMATLTSRVATKMPLGRENHGCVVLDDSRLLVWGGIGFPDPAIYNKATDSWSVINSFTDYNQEIYGKKCGGTVRANKYGNVNNDSLAIYGTGEDSSSGGSLFDLATLTERAIQTGGMVSNSNICSTGGGYVVYQHKSGLDSASGVYSTSKDIYYSASNIPMTGRANSGTLLHRDGTISYGPWEHGGVFHDDHYQYSLHGDSWVMGAALKWELSW